MHNIDHDNSPANSSGQVFVVANYDPPGNFIGSFSENVPPIGGFRKQSAGDNRALPNARKSTKTDSLESETREIDLDRFVLAMLRHHNEYRRKHGSPELKWVWSWEMGTDMIGILMDKRLYLD